MSHPDPVAHLARIGLAEAPPVTVEGLTRLQAAHMAGVPFENLDVRLGRGLDLSVEELFDKIVRRRRGGYCFELNTLYGALLDALGFERHFSLARVWYRAPHAVPAQSHVCHILRIKGRDWVSDVGFGGRTARVPLPLDMAANPDAVIEDSEGPVRLRRDADHGSMLERMLEGAWAPQFSFTGAPA